MTFKNQRTAYILAYVDSPPMQISHKTLGVAEPKFTKIL